MPKKPRQAHIPSQITRRRKARRTNGSTPLATSSSGMLAEPEPASLPVTESAAKRVEPAAERRSRRLDMLRAPQSPSTTSSSVRVVPGQLPTFERAYLMRELRQIALTGTILLAAIIVLTIVLRGVWLLRKTPPAAPR